MRWKLGPALAVLAFVGCASKPDDGSEPRLVVADLDPTSYVAYVHPVVERKCGTLDCHGQVARGLRVYGKLGLRLPNTADRTSSSVFPTTPEEARATYDSIVGLQPELTNELAAKTNRTPDDAYELIFLLKPLAIERHRPGRSLAKGEPAEQCMLSWLMGKTDAVACDAATKAPSPRP